MSNNTMPQVIDLISDLGSERDDDEQADLVAIFGHVDDSDDASNRITGNKRARNDMASNCSSNESACASAVDNDKCPICTLDVQKFGDQPSMRFGCCNNVFHLQCALPCIGGRFRGCPTCRSDYHMHIKEAFIDKVREYEETQFRYQAACREVRIRDDSIRDMQINMRRDRDINDSLHNDKRRLTAEVVRMTEACEMEETRRLASERISHELHEASCRTIDALQSDLKLAVRCLYQADDSARVADESVHRFFQNASIMKPRRTFWNAKCVKSLFGKYAVQYGASSVPCENTADDDINVAVDESDDE